MTAGNIILSYISFLTSQKYPLIVAYRACCSETLCKCIVHMPSRALTKTLHRLKRVRVRCLRPLANVKITSQLESEDFMPTQKLCFLPCQMCMEGHVIFGIRDKSSFDPNHMTAGASIPALRPSPQCDVPAYQ